MIARTLAAHLIAILLLAGLPALIATLLAQPQATQQPAPDPITVIDGDTIEWRGQRVRLLGYDTPEIGQAKCADERQLGEAAKWRLEFLIWGGGAEVTLSGRRDRYGRELGRLIVRGRDVADILIREGLARAYDGGRRQSWCGH